MANNYTSLAMGISLEILVQEITATIFGILIYDQEFLQSTHNVSIIYNNKFSNKKKICGLATLRLQKKYSSINWQKSST